MNWWQQLSTGHLYLDGFESLFTAIKIRIPEWVSVFLAEDEGFEPPQTESESGVLPLHKSSIWNSSIICKISEMSILFFHFFQIIFLPWGLARHEEPLSDRKRSPSPLFPPASSRYTAVLPGFLDAFYPSPAPG